MSRSFDSPWKDALDEYLKEILELFFPALFETVDWSRGFLPLDAELSEILRDAELGPTIGDRLYRVFTLSGSPLQILIHIEVQTQYDADLARRMFVYYYRIMDKYNEHIESIAILGDENRNWRPTEFEITGIGTRLNFAFHAVKLYDWCERIDELANGANPVGIIVAAHLQSLLTHGCDSDRKNAKWTLVRILLDRGLTELQVRKMYRLIDWFLELPTELQIQLRAEIRAYEEERHMPYIVSDERIAREEGRQEGRQEGRHVGLADGLNVCLKLKFGSQGTAWAEEIRSQNLSLDQLSLLLQAVESVNSLEELKSLVNRAN